jgi:hypothetical protein
MAGEANFALVVLAHGGDRDRVVEKFFADHGGDARERVTIAMASRGTNPTHTTRTLFEVGVWDAMYGSGWLQHEKPSLWVVGSTLVANARNKLCEMFLALEEKPEWLLFLDDDQLYPQALIEHLMMAVRMVRETGQECQVVGVPVWRFLGDTDVRVTHNVFDMNESNTFEPRTDDMPEGTVLQVAGIGAGCLLIHRDALLATRDASVNLGMGDRNAWFRHIVWPYNEGEDLYFSRLLIAAKIPLYVTTAMGNLEHVKTVRLDRAYDAGLLTI